MSQLSEGENVITVVATDGAGLTTTAALTVYCEPYAATSTPTAPTPPSTPQSHSSSQPRAAGTLQQTSMVTAASHRPGDLMILQAAAGAITL